MKAILFFLVFLALGLSSQSQVAGLWEVKSVTTDGDTLTPVAKWYQFNNDESMQSGNGLLQNGGGNYLLLPQNTGLFFMNQFGRPDEHGMFRLSFGGDKMIWEREENNRLVKVILQKTTEKPLAPWDKIVGSWDLTKSSENDDVEGKGIVMDWDREYLASGELFGENTKGIWHINSRKPQLMLIASDRKIAPMNFTLSFEDVYRMTWLSDDGKTKLIFQRNLQ